MNDPLFIQADDPDWLAMTPDERMALANALTTQMGGSVGVTPAAKKPAPSPPSLPTLAEMRQMVVSSPDDVIFGDPPKSKPKPRALPTVARPLPAPPRPPSTSAVGAPQIAKREAIPPIPAAIKAKIAPPPARAAEIREPHPEIQIQPDAKIPLEAAAESALKGAGVVRGLNEPLPEDAAEKLREIDKKALGTAFELTTIPAQKRVIEMMRQGIPAEEAFQRSPFAVTPLGGPPGTLGAGFTIPKFFKRVPEGIESHIDFGSGKPSLAETLKAQYRNARTKYIKELDPITRAEKAMGGTGEIDTMARATKGLGGKVREILKSGPLDFHTNRPVKGIQSYEWILSEARRIGPKATIGQILEESPGVREFRRFGTAARILEAEERGIQTGADMGVAVADYNKFRNTYEPLFDELQKFQNANLRYLLDAGHLHPDVYHAILEKNAAYLPMQRALELEEIYRTSGGGKKFANLQNGLKKIIGSDAKIIDPLESVVKHTYDMIASADKNAVGQALVQLAARNPASALIKKAKVTDPDAFHVTIGGEKRYFKTSDPELAELLKGKTPEEMKLWEKLLKYPAGWLRAGATQTPEFMAMNPGRDTQAAFIQSRYGFIPAYDSFRGFLHTIGRTDLYKQWMRSGGSNSLLTTIDRNANQELLREFATDPKKRAAWNIVNPLEAFRALSDLGEKSTRMGELARGIQAGGQRRALPSFKGELQTEVPAHLTKGQLADISVGSRDSTVDFGQMGKKMQALNSIDAFLNARIGGINRMVETLDPKRNPQATAAWLKATAGITVPSVILSYYNVQDPRHEQVQDWEKIAFWHIYTPERVYRIPKPPGYATIFSTLFEVAVEHLFKHDPEAFKRIGQSFAQEVPNIIPTGFLVPGELWANKSYFRDSRIVPPHLEKREPESRFTETTPESAKFLGKLPKAIGLPGLPPAQIEHGIRGVLGGTGGHAMEIADYLLPEGREAKAKAPKTGIEKAPLVKTFISGFERGDNRIRSKFYEKYRQAEIKHTEYRAKLKEDPDGAEVYRQENLKAIQDFDRMRDIAESLRDLNKSRRQVKGGDLSPEAKATKLKEIDKRMIDFARPYIGGPK